MLIARAPVCIGLGGSGTDLPSYYQRYGGQVITATISYYVYAILTNSHLDGVQVIYADSRASLHQSGDDLVWTKDLSLPKAIAYHFNIREGMNIFLASQIAPGSGLGLSGSVSVSMIKGLAFCCGLDLGPREVAELASYIEIDKMNMPVGRKDQYATAFGGLNSISFSRDGVIVEPLCLSPDTREALQRGLMLLSTGVSHDSSAVVRQLEKASLENDRATTRRLDVIKALGSEIRVALERGDLEAFGELLHRSWVEQRRLAEGMTTPELDRCYETARTRGVLGGLVTGTGGGGFLLLYCPQERQEEVAQALAAFGLQRWPCALEDLGVQVMQALPWSRAPMMPGSAWSQSPIQHQTSPPMARPMSGQAGFLADHLG